MHSLGFTSMKRAREGVDVTVTLQMLAWVKKRCGTIRCEIVLCAGHRDTHFFWK